MYTTDGRVSFHRSTLSLYKHAPCLTRNGWLLALPTVFFGLGWLFSLIIYYLVQPRKGDYHRTTTTSTTTTIFMWRIAQGKKSSNVLLSRPLYLRVAVTRLKLDRWIESKPVYNTSCSWTFLVSHILPFLLPHSCGPNDDEWRLSRPNKADQFCRRFDRNRSFLPIGICNTGRPAIDCRPVSEGGRNYNVTCIQRSTTWV